MQAFVFVACSANMVRLLGLGAGWRGLGVGWGLAYVREMALATAMVTIGVAACDGGGVTRNGMGVSLLQMGSIAL